MTADNARHAVLTTVDEVMADCEAFEAAMVEAGYSRPDLGRHIGMYRYQRDQDRFAGWKLARAMLAAQSADASNAAMGQAMPSLNDAMREVLRNERCVYGSEDALYGALVAAVPATRSGENAREPVMWQWRRKGDPWTLEYTFAYEVFATTVDSEVRALYANPAPAAQADVVPSFDCSLAAIDAHDPQSFIDGAKWAQTRLASQQSATPADAASEADKSGDDMVQWIELWDAARETYNATYAETRFQKRSHVKEVADRAEASGKRLRDAMESLRETVIEAREAVDSRRAAMSNQAQKGGES